MWGEGVRKGGFPFESLHILSKKETPSEEGARKKGGFAFGENTRALRLTSELVDLRAE